VGRSDRYMAKIPKIRLDMAVVFVSLLCLLALIASVLASNVQSGLNKPVFGISLSQDPENYRVPPFVEGGKIFVNGQILDYNGTISDVTSPIYDLDTNQPVVIGRMSQMSEDDLASVIDSAKSAWHYGQGVWPQMSFNQRIAALERVVESIQTRRDEIIEVLMWEICKTYSDAASEFDRTMKFISSVIEAFKEIDAQDNVWRTIEGVTARIRRAAIGTFRINNVYFTYTSNLCLLPYINH
jgi:glyceraldehyde-3-phosphate dehydrogenase (NADP+)